MAEMPHKNRHENTGRPRQALFLDRDGVINIDRRFVAKRADFEWRAGIFRLVKTATCHGIPVVVVTNQSGIGRGYYTQADFDALNEWMCAEFHRRGTPITRVYHCAHHPEATRPELKADHPWRKPAPGMILAAQTDLGLDLSRSVMIGDQWNDMLAANRAGVGIALLVGKPRKPAPKPMPPVIRFDNMESIADWYAEYVQIRSAHPATSTP